jgi:hypothetical protein
MDHDEAHLIVPIDAQKEEFPVTVGKGNDLFRAVDRLPVDSGDDISFGKAAIRRDALWIDCYHKGAAHLPVCR